MSNLSSKDLIDEICLIELITADVIVDQIEERYSYGYSVDDYLNNVPLPSLARMDLERRLRNDTIEGMKIVDEMREKGKRSVRYSARFLIVFFGTIYLIGEHLV